MTSICQDVADAFDIFQSFHGFSSCEFGQEILNAPSIPLLENRIQDYHTDDVVECSIKAPADTDVGINAAYLESRESQAKMRRRGSYKCSRCGQPKKGHTCVDTPEKPVMPLKREDHQSPDVQLHVGTLAPPAPQGANLKSVVSPFTPPSISSSTGLSDGTVRIAKARRSFIWPTESHQAAAAPGNIASNPLAQEEIVKGTSSSSIACLLNILARLSPTALLNTSLVCKHWQQCANAVWPAVREAYLVLSASSRGVKLENQAHINSFPRRDHVIPVLRKCPNVTRLTLSVMSCIEDSILMSIASSIPQLSSLEIAVSRNGRNAITGKGLVHLFEGCKSLSCLKLERCEGLRCLSIDSSSLTTLWLSGCWELKNIALDCPLLSELSLDFLRNEVDSVCAADSLDAIMYYIGENLNNLVKLHVASPLLDDKAVCQLMRQKFMHMRMLSLVYGSGITDESITLITSCCFNLELLDLSGSSITDSAFGLISDAFSGSLTRLLVAACPELTTVGVQNALCQFQLLQLLDCGRCWRDQMCGETAARSIDSFLNRKCAKKALTLQHLRLKKLSLWGWSDIKELNLECPQLSDVNLNGCLSLEPELTVINCPKLEEVHTTYCRDSLRQVIHRQVKMSFEAMRTSTRWQADGSKRIQAPYCGLFVDMERPLKISSQAALTLPS